MTLNAMMEVGMPFYAELRKPHPEGGAKEELRKRTVARLQRLRSALKAHFPADTDRSRSLRMSDHLPMWVELTSDFSDEYLAACAVGQP